MAFTRDYDDIDYGDEVRGESVQTVSLPHASSQASDLPEGTAVAWDSTANGGDGAIVAADGSNSLPAIGVLYTYQYYAGNSGGSQIRTDRKATVAVGGKLKVRVESDVSPGPVAAADTAGGDTAGNLSGDGADASSNFTALSTARSQDDRFGNTANYAEVLLR